MNRFQDLKLNQLALQKSYYQHYIAGDIVGAWQIIDANPSLEPTVLGAANMNILVNSILDLENLYKTNVTDTLAILQTEQQMEIGQLIYVGEYVPGVPYKKFNFVTRGSAILFFFQDMVGADPTPYSVALLLGGEAGAPGLGVNWRDIWSSSATYVQYDMVSFSNKLYVALIASVGASPATSLTSWELVVSPNVARIYVSDTEPENLPVGGIWFKIIHQYIIRWDKVNSQCTRLGDAAAITTDITHFAYRGSVDPDYNNPFDSIYPWSQRKLCKVSLADYQAIYAAGGDILGSVTLWEDEPGFALGDSVPGMDMVYTPTFWDYVWEDADYVYVGVADGEVPGWNKRPATIGARYHASDDGAGGLTSLAGTIAKRFTPMNTLHERATAQSMTIDDIYTWSDDTTLLCVEFATLNSQVAVGDGVSDLYKQDATGHPLEAATASNSVILPTSYKSRAIVDSVLDIGAALGAGDIGSRIVVSAVDYTDPAYCVITFSGEPVDVAPTQFWAIHGLSNTMNAEIGSKSGYIGANSRSIAYYRGREAHGNYWRYVLGAYRQENTGHIWTADSREQAGEYDALNTAVHTDTGFILPQGEGGTDISGYLDSIYLPPKTPLSPFGKSVGGTSLNPIGDSIYVPALATANTILIAGAPAYSGAIVGRFSDDWSRSASSSFWSFAVLLFLKNPLEA